MSLKVPSSVAERQHEIMRHLMEEHPLLLRDEYQAIAAIARAPSEARMAAANADLERALVAEDQARCPVVQVLPEKDQYAAYWGHNKMLLTVDEVGSPAPKFGIVMPVADSHRFFSIPDAVRNHLHGDKEDPEHALAVTLIADGALDALRVGDDATEFLAGITKIGSFTNHEDDDEPDDDE